MLANWVVEDEGGGRIKVREPLASCLGTDIDHIWRINGTHLMYSNAKTPEQALDIYKKLKAAYKASPCYRCDRRVDIKCGGRTRMRCKAYNSWKQEVLGKE